MIGYENAHWCAQNAENGFGFDFFRIVPQRKRLISQSHRRVTGDKAWVSFGNVETNA
jgi:hypothetical protein